MAKYFRQMVAAIGRAPFRYALLAGAIALCFQNCSGFRSATSSSASTSALAIQFCSNTPTANANSALGMWQVVASFASASQISLLGFDCSTQNVVFKSTADAGASWQENQMPTNNFGNGVESGEFYPIIKSNGYLFDSLVTTNGNPPAYSHLIYRTPLSTNWQSIEIGSLGYINVSSVGLTPSSDYFLAGTCRTVSSSNAPCVGTMNANFQVGAPITFKSETIGGIQDATVGYDNCIYAGGYKTNAVSAHDYLVMQSCDSASTQWAQDTTDSAAVGQEFYVLKMLSADNNIYFAGMGTVDNSHFYLTFAKRVKAGQWQAANIAGPFVPQQIDVDLLASTSACHYDLLYNAEQTPLNPNGFIATLLQTSDCGSTWQVVNSKPGYILGANLIGDKVYFMMADQKGGYTVTSW